MAMTVLSVLPEAADLDVRILATDIDAQAASVARDNAKLNGVGNLVQSVQATGFNSPAFKASGPFGLVLANILAKPLRSLAPEMVAHLAPSAFVILSGLLPPQANSVVAAYCGSRLKLIRRVQIDGWTSLLMQKR